MDDYVFWAVAITRANPTYEESSEPCVEGLPRWVEKSTQLNKNGVGTDADPAEALLAQLPNYLQGRRHKEKQPANTSVYIRLVQRGQR